MMKKKTFPAKPESLEAIRSFVDEIAEIAGLDKKKTYKLKLAIDEIAANIINYGYLENEDPDHSIDVLARLADEKVTIVLEDDAAPFNPLDKELPGEEALSLPPEDRPIGGLGLMLARSNVDNFSYEHCEGKNRNFFSVNIT